MSFEDSNKGPLRKGISLEGVTRDLKTLRPDTYKSYSIRENPSGDRIGVNIIIGENSIIDEHQVEGRYEIFPRVNKEKISDIFGTYPDDVCRYLTLEQALNIADAAVAAKSDPGKLPELKRTIDSCYPDGFPEGILGMFSDFMSAEQYEKPDVIRDRVRKQFVRHIDDPKKKLKDRESE